MCGALNFRTTFIIQNKRIMFYRPPTLPIAVSRAAVSDFTVIFRLPEYLSVTRATLTKTLTHSNTAGLKLYMYAQDS